MNATHSQGQWEVDNYGTPELLDGIRAQFVILSDDGPVAYVYTENDARLLAAAPELLEALLKYSLPIDTKNIALSRIEFGSEAVERELQRRAAIAKATGEQA